MRNLSKVKLFFDGEIQKLERAIKSEKAARDDAPSAMESHSDTTRNQKDMIIHALSAKLRMLKAQVASIPDTASEKGLWSIAYSDELKSEVLIVPDGMGGVETGGFILVSAGSPVAKELLR